jgi:L,D-peptidoglycan transpeptidase YkuD (ErfK/YbiS/YcfS/YnhG family)/predicted deacylase
MTRIPTLVVRIPRAGQPPHHGSLTIGSWTVPCVIGSGGLIAASDKREGDKCTPIGNFPLRYGLVDRVSLPDFPRDLAFPFAAQTDAMIWEEDGPDYNRLVLADDDERRNERLTRRRAEGLFDIIVPIGFNDAVAETGRGSALFIHGARPDMRGTAGCVAVSREHLRELATRLEPGMAIDIGYEAPADAPPATGEFGPIEMVRFAGAQPGPALLVLGAIHGNETCGPQAITRAIADCRAGRMVIRHGSVTFVPIVNLKAYRQGTREGDRNLNRDLREREQPHSHEDRVANVLCPLLREHDVLLDIHSFRSAGEPFVFVGPRDNDGKLEPFALAEPEGELARHLGPQHIMHGWLDTYARAAGERRRRGGSGDPREGIGTTEYMRAFGGYGVTLECGQHDDPEAPHVAYAAIVNTLSHLGLIDAPRPKPTVTHGIEVVDVVLCLDAGDRLEGAWKTGDPVTSGQVIARRADGEALVAPRDGFVIFPDAAPKPLKELYYFGVPSDRFP